MRSAVRSTLAPNRRGIVRKIDHLVKELTHFSRGGV